MSATIEELSELPPFHDYFSPDINIRIYQIGNKYNAEVRARGIKPQRIRIDLTQKDMQRLNKKLQDSIEQVSWSFDSETENGPDLSELAHAGLFAFNVIFAKDGPREIMQKAIKTVRETSNQKNVAIEISSDDFFLPWELLYDGPLNDDQVDASCFWGMRHVISRTIILNNCPGAMVSPVIRSPRPKVGLIVCEELQHVKEIEIPFLVELANQERIDLSQLDPLDPVLHNTGLQSFGRFLGKDLQIAHLACHAHENKKASEPYLIVSNSFHITMEDFHVYEFETISNPLVNLNACLTGVNNPLCTSNWASLFWKQGARGVLATEFRVPDRFAAIFVEKLYAQFLSGIPIGEALLTTRRHFWDRERNPLGLAYALYSPLDIRIVST
jgi:hypothetical protein